MFVMHLYFSILKSYHPGITTLSSFPLVSPLHGVGGRVSPTQCWCYLFGFSLPGLTWHCEDLVWSPEPRLRRLKDARRSPLCSSPLVEHLIVPAFERYK